MRDSNQRCIGTNKPVITITSTVYDRRALDLNSNIPLINSLNHLTYLTSNSAKVRETIASDGALERLVSILHDCHLNLKDCIENGNSTNNNKSLNNSDRIRQQKKLALCAWKWTLAFQCLVLTGTRGTEFIRQNVVASGMIPVLATVLDNYLLYHANYDHITESYLNFDFKILAGSDMYLLLSTSNSESYEEYIKSLIGNDTLGLSLNFEQETSDYDDIDLSAPAMTIPTDFGDIWNRYKLAKNIYDGNIKFTEDGNEMRNENENDTDYNYFNEGIDQRPAIVSPREFFLGRIVPKQDDLIWSLQLLAFISKYTYMKRQLQNVELVKSLSFRTVIERVKKRFEDVEKRNEINNNKNTIHENNGFTFISSSKRSIDDSLLPKSEAIQKNNDSSHDNDHEFNSIDEPNNKFISGGKCSKFSNLDSNILMELQNLSNKCKQDYPTSDYFNKDIIIPKANGSDNYGNADDRRSKRLQKENYINKHFNNLWDYNKFSKKLDDETLNFIQNKNILNIFPLVEKFTVGTENPQDVIYWSSVIMRNSCRKNEMTGVRQCASFSCGKWEEYPRQFAKCRRCKRTKYCSRKCQLHAWKYHRFWCHEVNCNSKSASTKTATRTSTVSPGNTSAATITSASTLTTNGVDRINITSNTINSPQSNEDNNENNDNNDNNNHSSTSVIS